MQLHGPTAKKTELDRYVGRQAFIETRAGGRTESRDGERMPRAKLARRTRVGDRDGVYVGRWLMTKKRDGEAVKVMAEARRSGSKRED